MNAVVAIVQRDLLLSFRRRNEILTVLFFFTMVASLFPLAVSPEAAWLRRIGPGVLWVAALLATLLSLSRLFAGDHQDGCLDQLSLSPLPLPFLVWGKIFAYWLVSGLPLVVIAPLLGLQFGLDAGALETLTIALLLGTPTLALLGAIGAALTLGVRGGGMLLGLLVLPLYVPTLIFGASAVEAQNAGLDAKAYLSLLAALFAITLFFAPLATAAALRLAIE